jgi:hypothetical protein
VVAEKNIFGQIVRHLQQLKRQLEREGVTATIDSPKGGTRVTLRVPGVDGDVTCRSNSADANHLWFWLNNEPLTPAGGIDEVRAAANLIHGVGRGSAPASTP